MFFEYLNSYLKNPQFVFLLLNLARLSKKHNCSLNNQIKWLSKLFQIRIGISLIIRWNKLDWAVSIGIAESKRYQHFLANFCKISIQNSKISIKVTYKFQKTSKKLLINKIPESFFPSESHFLIFPLI